ncbi:MAG: gfo/Idh/MocA family oxidoreductase [Candidatus Omnitrophota bacterium]|jgi:predicted dehydrogenase|nr:MAG: gfo/Idh/MocA family oxidoreductase [Candidatus Omnitrophota bacterium]
MNEQKQNRREFIHNSISGGAAAGVITAGFTASGYGRVLGANDKIRIGLIGCGGRGTYHLGWVHRTAEETKADVVAACDIWNVKREQAAQVIEERFERKPVLYEDYRKLLDSSEIDAVIIASADHQHCAMLRDAVRAGKDAYVEKPIAMELDDLNQAYDVVKKSLAIVQNGTQGRSSQGAAGAKAFIQAGKLGKILRVEESRSFYNPYWNNYQVPEKEEDTNWRAFLMNRPYRPFNPDQHGHWMGYKEFSSGTVGGWMSHFSDFIHYVTDCGFPAAAVAQGGVFSPTSQPGRTAPDTVTAILEYAEGFTTLYTTHFGNGANDYMIIFGTKGIMRINAPDGNDSGGILPRVTAEGSEHPEKVPEGTEIEDEPCDDHMTNWLKCVRSREQPNANMDKGYMQGVAVILADRAYEEGRKMVFDPTWREIKPA